MNALLTIAVLLGAQADTTTIYRGDEGELEVRPPRIESAKIEVDGLFDEAAWRRTAVLTGFTRYYPTEGLPAEESTAVRVFYDHDAIYFAIEAMDSEPAEVFANVSERDQTVFGNDRLAVLLDTFGRQQQAYAFYVNPLGLQTDGFWLESSTDDGEPVRGIGPVDTNPDFLWESTGRITKRGWQVEMRIPFVSLRFPQAEQQRWGINIIREIRRVGYRQSWAPLSESQSSTLAQQGYLIAMDGVKPERLIEANPVLTGSWSGQREGGGEFVRKGLTPEVGLNFRLGITNDLTFGTTVNPDFSQVESDADQVTVNERFALFLPEKRPFFLEGTEVFETPMRLVHTRTIVEPAGGVKLAGKLGSFDVAYLGALDESPSTVQRAHHRAFFNLARIRWDFGNSSNLGVLYTDRTEIEGGLGANRLAGLDGRFLFGRNYIVSFQSAGAWTRTERQDPEPEEGETLSSFGTLAQFRVARTGREFNWGLQFEDTSDDFRAESGLIRRVGDARVLGRLEFNTFPKQGSFVEKAGLRVRSENYFSHSDFWDLKSPYEWSFALEPNVTLRGGNPTSLSFEASSFWFRAMEYENYSFVDSGGVRRPFVVPESIGGLLGVRLASRYRFSSSLSVDADLRVEELPLFVEASEGWEIEIAPGIDYQPTREANIELTYTHSRIRRDRDGSVFSKADLPRLKVQYMLSRSLFVRVITQYNLQQRAELEDPRTGEPIWINGAPAESVETGVFGAQVLISYEPSPSTMFFVGWTRRMKGPRTTTLGELDLLEDSVFMKVSYLHRF